ncbi:unnamed protein product [Rotaria sp. Silwood1]|nr:unnamed protein product [Rotaria sp. Silwood1]
MLITTTTGYILAAYGPYLSDNSNNDASIQKDMLVNNKDGILNWFDEHDIAVVDRGFRDSTGMMRALELDVCMPDFLNGRRRFDALEANRSRFTSKIRWVVESANGRVKHFKWFNQTIQNSTIPQVRDYLQIACALINAYRAAAISSFSNDDRIAAKMLACFHEPNLLRIRLNNETLRWINNDASNIVNFPILTIDQIRLITVDGILNWIDEHDIVVGDRGFQDSTGMMRALGLDIACALINAYRAAAISSFSNDDQIAAKMLACLHESNLLRTRLNNEILHWTTNDASNIINFLVFTIDQILVIIVGM